MARGSPQMPRGTGDGELPPVDLNWFRNAFHCALEAGDPQVAAPARVWIRILRQARAARRMRCAIFRPLETQIALERAFGAGIQARYRGQPGEGREGQPDVVQAGLPQRGT